MRLPNNVIIAVVMVLAAAVGVEVATGAAAYAATSPIVGSGSTAAFTALNQWTNDVASQGLQVDYQASSSAQGLQDFANGLTDYSVSDFGYQGSGYSSPRPYSYVPILANSTAFPYNLIVDGQRLENLRLSDLTLAKIFTDQITNWDDPEITADNNGRQLPPIPIVPVVHSEQAGITYEFTNWLDTEYPSLWQSFSGDDAAVSYWPTGLGNQVAENGSDGVMNFIQSGAGQGSIGFDEYEYPFLQQDPVAQIENAAGYFTVPTADDVAISLAQAQINSDPSSPDYGLQDLTGVYTDTDPNTYPLSWYSYMVIPTGASDPTMTTAKRQTLADFIDYSICPGQSEVGSIGYGPLPLNLVQAGFQAMGLLQTADPGVDLSGMSLSACNNPTFLAGNPTNNYLAAITPLPPSCDMVGHGPCSAQENSIGTGAALAGPATALVGSPVTLTATVAESDAPTTAGLSGTMEFFDGTALLASSSTETAGVYSVAVTFATVGVHDITAVFNPSDPAYEFAISQVVPVDAFTFGAACSATGSSCSDAQDLQETVNPGALTISTPYTPGNPFVLPPFSLSADGTYLETSATFPAATNPAAEQIVVTSTLAGDPGWTLSISATNLVDGTGGTIESSGLGLTDGALLDAGGFPGSVTFHNIASHNPSPLDTDTNTGLGSTPQTWATTPAGDGTAVMSATLTLLAPTSVPAGSYTGTITFSVT